MIDEQIREALDVDPSPEFLARVRTRIASEPAPSAWRSSWTVAAVGALAAALVIAVVVSRTSTGATQPFRPAADNAGSRPGTAEGDTKRSADAFALHPGSHTAPAVARQKPRATPMVPGLSRTISASIEPEILIDPREGIALQRLLAGVRGGRVNLEPLARAVAQRGNALDDLQPPADIVIPLLPLTPAPGEGDRQ
jgi:hypothetical protein